MNKIKIAHRSESRYLKEKGQFPYFPARGASNAQHDLVFHCVLATPTGRVSKYLYTRTLRMDFAMDAGREGIAYYLKQWLQNTVGVDLLKRKLAGYSILELVQNTGDTMVGAEVELPISRGQFKITPWTFNPVHGEAWPAKGIAYLSTCGSKTEAIWRAEQVLRARSVEGGDLHGLGLSGFEVEYPSPNGPWLDKCTFTIGGEQ